MNLNSVRHVRILDDQEVKNYPYHFPQATILSIESSLFWRSLSYVIDYKRIIPLQNITELKITHHQFSFDKLLEMLLSTPNLVTLTVTSITVNSTDYKSIQKSEKFQSISNGNIIRNLTLVYVTRVQEVKLIFTLCPRVQSFTIEGRTHPIGRIIRFLFSKNNVTTRYLTLLSISIKYERSLKRILSLNREGQLLADCFVKADRNHAYLWR
jgi:hypothetical protein